ncbi:MAG: SURF1 family protein [Rubrivivax sp.]|nr:SURF1 family protein [Rubrivivax sp.]
MMLRNGLVLLATLVGMVVTARLGVWQLDRAGQKQRLQAAIEQQEALPPLAENQLAQDTAQAEAQEHRRTTLRGTWLPDATVFLDNRQMNARVGFFVLTPLRLADGSAVLVQRGWRARDFIDRARLAPVATPAGEVEVSGRLARGPARLYEFEGAASGPIRQNLALDVFGRETGLALRPVMLLQTGTSTDDGLARDWPRPDLGLQKHHGYAFQWFALCALIGGLHVWFQILRPRRLRRSLA